MKVRMLVVWALLLTAALVFGACAAPAAPAADTGAAAEEPAAEAEASEGRDDAASVALVLIGPKDDNSWAEAAYNALEGLAAEGVQTAFSESVSDADVARVMREYADEGYDLIVAHSFSYQDAVFEVAAEYPDVNFAWAGGIARTAENVSDYDQPFHEPSYLVGILAGYMSPSGKLGALYGFDIPACHSMGEAMLLGAQTVNPDATLTVTAVGDWGDVAAAKEAGTAQVDTAGVDYWIGCGEGPTLGAIEAANEAGAYATGYVGDMSALGPESVLSSIVWDMGTIFGELYEQTAAGNAYGAQINYGVAAGALDIALNEGLADAIPAEALETIEATRAQIAAGEFEVPFIPE
jgi:basic membrane protein A